jgi:hypothetical protein
MVKLKWRLIMTERAVVIQEIKTLPANRVTEVLDFVGYLKQKEAASPCPLCAIYHEPNAETIAAMEEGDAMERDEIPANRFHSFEEMWEDLHK